MNPDSRKCVCTADSAHSYTGHMNQCIPHRETLMNHILCVWRPVCGDYRLTAQSKDFDPVTMVVYHMTWSPVAGRWQLSKIQQPATTLRPLTAELTDHWETLCDEQFLWGCSRHCWPSRVFGAYGARQWHRLRTQQWNKVIPVSCQWSYCYG